ncbi:beta-ketoacyl-ACP synthase III [Actinomarinicola tropica]|uniref:Beta-ketoacyl-[acyl-carrier-protein] synthase III n=1 Tax=Actinomarinicola tropica TaxID=2789776 RepID=A0A5Q2RN22_9ACTN|nr:beta-ketoacyl-ACP synthase III [Actinomarinicola tropica]QGG95487.1 beta-ketoacyl-ACP synthase III [Actinomarinicola tropica]
MRGAQIKGWGSALPEKVVTNKDLESTLDTNDEWIVERTGIRERRIGGSTSGLAIEASRLAMARAGWEPETVDLLILATTSPDQQIPASASTVQNELGLTCGAFDLNAACSGFVYALVAAHGFVQTGLSRILVIGSDTLSRLTDWEDRGTAILFADGAGAAAVEAVDGPGELLGYDLGSDGSARHILDADIGGYMHMDGKEVFRRAVRVMVASGNAALERAGLTIDDIDHVVPHQANIRIIESACKKLGVPVEKAVTVLDRTGNTSAASIPLALVDGVDSGRIQPGDTILFVGFGAGMTWASAVVRWQP